MAFSCHCGSHRFSPLGIMDGYPRPRGEGGTRILFLVNCLECGTTLSCTSLDYYLLRSSEFIRSMDDNFFGAERRPFYNQPVG